ncbi:MAG: prepilin-type N-terminal cleavage/methylation domain-containing protein [Caldiserica bacterium]|nr:prepilin-type N-terminal cleavage/methylation domain-containing protein [Caldisericota bacterium]
MRQTTGHHSYVGSRAVVSRHGLSPASPARRRRPGLTPRGLFHNPRGFTLIELVVAMAILLIVMVGVLSSISFAYNSSTDTELRNTAKNVASYTLEYLRARTVTRGNTTLYDLLNPSGAPATGTYRWYDAAANSNGALPSMIDMGNLPLQSNGWPCNYTSAYVRTNAKKDGDTNPADLGGVVAGGAVLQFTSKHAASPTQAYVTQPLAFTSTLQGYVSVRDMTDPGSTTNPALPEDGNLARMHFSSGDAASGTYRTTPTDLESLGAWTDLVVRYPGVYLSSLPYITSFTPLTGYIAKVYTTDGNKVLKTNQAYNPYYTNVAGDQAGTQAYRGFRVLTQIVARSTLAVDVNGFRQVQYYDVTVTVLWMNGTHESNYELVSRIVAY